ncbi:hypothetical protein [Loigolactobacillus jiayinensis]|uniref:Uncharacterized protein n=1 Tax=Loigolactobacillus jiayinensis TaxID=2486016 RepID=A0ABW1RB16_9LACO|nr:hypothetical protein [Loigolactobacillus jiayinensis]
MTKPTKFIQVLMVQKTTTANEPARFVLGYTKKTAQPTITTTLDSQQALTICLDPADSDYIKTPLNLAKEWKKAFTNFIEINETQALSKAAVKALTQERNQLKKSLKAQLKAQFELAPTRPIKPDLQKGNVTPAGYNYFFEKYNNDMSWLIFQKSKRTLAENQTMQSTRGDFISYAAGLAYDSDHLALNTLVVLLNPSGGKTLNPDVNFREFHAAKNPTNRGLRQMCAEYHFQPEQGPKLDLQGALATDLIPQMIETKSPKVNLNAIGVDAAVARLWRIANAMIFYNAKNPHHDTPRLDVVFMLTQTNNKKSAISAAPQHFVDQLLTTDFANKFLFAAGLAANDPTAIRVFKVDGHPSAQNNDRRATDYYALTKQMQPQIAAGATSVDQVLLTPSQQQSYAQLLAKTDLDWPNYSDQYKQPDCVAYNTYQDIPDAVASFGNFSKNAPKYAVKYAGWQTNDAVIHYVEKFGSTDNFKTNLTIISTTNQTSAWPFLHDAAIDQLRAVIKQPALTVLQLDGSVVTKLELTPYLAELVTVQLKGDEQTFIS